MTMTHGGLWLLLLGLGLGTGCAGKPSAEDCKQAVDNVRKLTGQAHAQGGSDPKAAVRSCRAHSKKETVACQIAAKSLDDLAKCEGEEGQKFLDEQRKADEARAAEDKAAADKAAADKAAADKAAAGQPAE